MPLRQTAPIGAPCWIDLMTSDPERSRAFYSQLFGWTAEEPNPEFGGYFNFLKGGMRTAGCMTSQPGEGMANGWSIYLATDNAAKTLEATAAHGGVIHVPAMAVGDLGTMAMIADPDGAAIGVWQPGTFPGFGELAEPGSPGWFELYTRAYERDIEFYRRVFGWETQVVSDAPEFRYTVFKRGEEWLAGVMDGTSMLAEGAPAHWVAYFTVADTDAAVARVLRLGGQVVSAAEDTPYGRLAAAVDPNGARFKLVGPSAAMPARPVSS